jgi:NAD(P)-dependent dehydrogenase (short-subunit alcohol dehydrogenase family)
MCLDGGVVSINGAPWALRQGSRFAPRFRTIIETAVESHGRLDVMFNHSGLNVPQHFLESTKDAYNRIMDITCLGCWSTRKKRPAR